MAHIVTRPDRYGHKLVVGIYRTQADAQTFADSDDRLTRHPTAVPGANIEGGVAIRNCYLHPDDHVRTAPPAFSALYMAATELDGGLVNFLGFMDGYLDGQPSTAAPKVRQAIYQARRALRLIVGGGATNVTLTTAEKVAWCNMMRLGPADATVVTSVGQYSIQGLLHLFQLADANDLPGTPAGSVACAWVGTDPDAWTGGVPNRLNVANIAEVTGSYGVYLDMQDRTWLNGV